MPTKTSLRIRLARFGATNRPFYRIRVVDSKFKRDGRFIEQLGTFDPIPNNGRKFVRLNTDRIKYWIGNGALPSDACWKIFARFSLIPPKPFNSEFTYQKPAAITEIPDWWGLSSEEKALFEEREAHNAAQAQANEKTPPEFDS